MYTRPLRELDAADQGDVRRKSLIQKYFLVMVFTIHLKSINKETNNIRRFNNINIIRTINTRGIYDQLLLICIYNTWQFP